MNSWIDICLTKIFLSVPGYKSTGYIYRGGENDLSLSCSDILFGLYKRYITAVTTGPAMYRWYIVPTEISLRYRQYIAIISDCRLHYFFAELLKEIKEVKEKELKENEWRNKIWRREIKGKEEERGDEGRSREEYLSYEGGDKDK